MLNLERKRFRIAYAVAFDVAGRLPTLVAEPATVEPYAAPHLDGEWFIVRAADGWFAGPWREYDHAAAWLAGFREGRDAEGSG